MTQYEDEMDQFNRIERRLSKLQAKESYNASSEDHTEIAKLAILQLRSVARLKVLSVIERMEADSL